jgi:putative transposase
VSPDTVARWHRSGFALYWRAISKAREVVGRKRISKEVRDLTFRIVMENPTWGAPRIHRELLMLGFEVSERTISRWMRQAPQDPELAKRWLAFLRNHREAIAAMDFFTVPTITFGMLHCFFVMGHDRRRILHFNVTRHPTSLWVVQQLREAFPYESAPTFLIFDRDAKYGLEVLVAVRSMAIRPIRISFRSPWQNGIAERWVESCQRDLLDQVIAFNEHHLTRLLSDYVRYYHEDRTHLGFEQGNADGQNSVHESEGGRVSLAPGRLAPPLRSSRIISRLPASREVPCQQFRFVRVEPRFLQLTFAPDVQRFKLNQTGQATSERCFNFSPGQSFGEPQVLVAGNTATVHALSPKNCRISRAASSGRLIPRLA